MRAFILALRVVFMTPEQLAALEAVAAWMENQAAAASVVSEHDRSMTERMHASGRADAHLTCSLRLRRLIAEVSP